MVLRKDLCSRRAVGRRMRRAAIPAAALVALIALAACNPIDTWRDLTGASQNDPDPEATPNTANLAAGEASDYPNLATVPPPPTRALTAAERDKLTQSLIADRTNAKYTDDKLRAGFSAISAPVPPPPPPAPPPGEPADKAAKPAPAGAEAPPAQAPPAQAQGPRKEGEPPEPGPKESSLAPPQARETLTPEQSRPAPPLPRQVALPAAAGGTGAAHLPSPPGPAPMPAAIDTTKYQPPPPPPVLTRPAPARAAAAPEKRPAPAVSTPVGELKFAGASTSLADSEEPAVDKIVSSYRKEPGKIRVVGYAGVGTNGAGEQLASYRVALDRAQSVASALAKAGIPSDKILAEVAPAGADSGEGRAEVMLEH